MHVHLIAIEVSIVGRADRQVESEGVVGEYSYTMGHHAHPMEGRLAVEEHVIAVFKGALYDSAVAEMLLD